MRWRGWSRPGPDPDGARCLGYIERMVLSMPHFLRSAACLFSAVLVAGCASTESAVRAGDALLDPNPAPATLAVALPSVVDGRVPDESVYGGFGCTGGNRSLAVTWSNVPEKTQSFALVMHDPDAPTGVGFFHWTVFDLPPTARALELGASQSGLPSGSVQGYTDFGGSGYGGPCPPSGPPHRYVLSVYALDVPKLELGPNATGALVRFMVREHALAFGRATATYQRR